MSNAVSLILVELTQAFPACEVLLEGSCNGEQHQQGLAVCYLHAICRHARAAAGNAYGIGALTSRPCKARHFSNHLGGKTHVLISTFCIWPNCLEITPDSPQLLGPFVMASDTQN